MNRTAGAALLWGAAFAVYLRGAAGSVGGMDGGELAAAAYTLGVTHPPGYPLHALLGRLFMMLPAGTPAFRLHLLSAACAAGAVAVLYGFAAAELERRVRRPSSAALAAALAFGATQAVWYQAGIGDKYPLHLLLFGGTAALLFRGAPWPATLGLFGLCAAHHSQALYLVPGVALTAWRAGRPAVRSVLLGLALAVSAASLKAVYPAARAGHGPPLAYAGFTTARGARDYLRMRAYAHRIGPPTDPGRWRATLAGITGQLTLPGAFAGAAGLAAWATAAGTAGAAAWAAIAAGVALTAGLEIPAREYQVLPVVWLLAFGLAHLPVRGPPGVRRAAGLVVWALPAWLLAVNAGWVRQGRLALERDYGKALLDGVPANGLLFVSNDDQLFSTLYLQVVERRRPDVLVVSRGFLTLPQLRPLMRRKAPDLAGLLVGPAEPWTEEATSRRAAERYLGLGRRVFLTSSDRDELIGGLACAPRDAAYELVAGRDGAPVNPGWLPSRGWVRPRAPLTWMQRAIVSRIGGLQGEYASALAVAGRIEDALPRFRRALANPFLLDPDGIANNMATALASVDRTGEALALFRRLAASGTRRPEVYLNAGNLYARLGRFAEARGAYRQALEFAEPGSRAAAYARSRLEGGGPAAE